MAGLKQGVHSICNLSKSIPTDLLGDEHAIKKTHSALYVLALALGCISLAFSVACLIFNLLSRNNRVVKMSSPRLNIVIACGGILGSCVCMLLAADYFLETSMSIGHSVCQARAALLAVTFTLLFGPMVGKTWRVNQIFRLAGAKRVIIKDVRLVAFTTIMLCVDIIWTLLWNFVDPLEFMSIIVFDKAKDFSDTTNVISSENGVLIFSSASSSVATVAGCTSEWTTLWVAGLFLYKAPLLVWGLREAWWTRGHILPSINDSACLAFSSLTTGTAMLVYLLVGEAFRQSPTVVDACALASIWICVMVAIGFVFIPKVRAWRSTPKGERCRVSISSISNSMAFLQSFENIETEVGQAHTEIDSLKCFIKQKESDMDALQQLLSNAENSLAQIQLGHSDLDGPRGSPKSAGDIDRRKWRPKSDKSKGIKRESDENNNINADVDEEEERSPRWSGVDCGQSSSADEGGVTSEEVNSSLDIAGHKGGHSCCLHGSACHAGDGDAEKEEGSCWYLPSDRGYAPAHLLASNHRGRHHHRHHHHHHHHRRRRRVGMSAPLGHSFNRRHRTASASTPTTHNSIGHRAASSCGSSSVFTKGSSSNKHASVHNSSNVYVHYTKRGGGPPTRRHSHGSIYTQQLQQQEQQQHPNQQDLDLPRRLFDYPNSPNEIQHDLSPPYFSPDRRSPRHNQVISFRDQYDTDDASKPQISDNYPMATDPRGGSNRHKLGIPKHRKRRRSSTPSVQNASSYTKLSKLRSDLSDAMAISRRLMGDWSVESAPVDNTPVVISGQPHRTSTPLGAAKRALSKTSEKFRRQTVIGIQGIADSILESYNFQRTEDNHSFVYDCITPRRYASSPSKLGKNPESAPAQNPGKEFRDNGLDNNASVFSFNFYNASNQENYDFPNLESGHQHSRIELASFGYEDKKLNGFDNPTHSVQYSPHKIHSSHGNDINHPPSSAASPSRLTTQVHQNLPCHIESLRANTGQHLNPNYRYDKDLSAFQNVDTGFKDKATALRVLDNMESVEDTLVFLPPRNVSIQSMFN